VAVAVNLVALLLQAAVVARVDLYLPHHRQFLQALNTLSPLVRVAALVQQALMQQARMAEVAPLTLKLPQAAAVVAPALDRVVQVALAVAAVVLALVIQAAQVYLVRATMAARAVMQT
jgi:hypothetical protein